MRSSCNIFTITIGSLILSLLIFTTGCAIFRGTGHAVQSVGHGAGTMVEGIGEGTEQAVGGTGRAISGAANETEQDLKKKR